MVVAVVCVALVSACAASPPPKAATDVDRARALLDDHPDQSELILYNRLTDDHPGTADEYRVLIEACKKTNDKRCVDESERRLGTAR